MEILPARPRREFVILAAMCLRLEGAGVREAVGGVHRQLCRRLCARQCVHEMGAGPPQPACGGRLQTTLSGGGKEPLVVSVQGKGMA